MDEPISPILQWLIVWVNGEPVSDDVLYRLQQFGFIFPNMQGQLEITPYGTSTLKNF